MSELPDASEFILAEGELEDRSTILIPRRHQSCISSSLKILVADTIMPLYHIKLSTLGFSILQLTRFIAWRDGSVSSPCLGNLQIVTVAGDAVCFASGLPFWIPGSEEFCAYRYCLGPLLTTLFAFVLVDACSLCLMILSSKRRPMDHGSNVLLDTLEAFMSSLDILALSSVALQVALFVSVWRFYRALREAGLYPPNLTPRRRNANREVSVLEIVCESEDVALLQDCNCGRPRSHMPKGQFRSEEEHYFSPRTWPRDMDHERLHHASPV